jgi:hypothetical protein
MSGAIISGRNVARRLIRQLDGKQVASPAEVDGRRSTVIEATSVVAETAPPTRTIDVAGCTLPSTTLTAAGSERDFKMTALPSPALFIFHGESNTDVVAEANTAVRAHYPLASQLLMASIVDLHHIPRLFRSMAQSALKKAYERSAQLIPDELDPAQYVVILPDWDGAVTKVIGFEAVGESAGIAVVDEAGNLHGAFQGEGAAEAALTCLKRMM